MERWELIELLFLDRAEAARQALEILEEARQNENTGSGVLAPGQRR